MTGFHNNLHLEIVQGDDYMGADRISISGNGAAWPTTISSARFVCFMENGGCNQVLLDVDCEVSAGSVLIPLPRAKTITLPAGVRIFGFEVRALVPTNLVRTLARGRVTVLRGLV